MKNILLENLIRFAPKNLDIAGLRKFLQLQEQTPATIRASRAPINMPREYGVSLYKPVKITKYANTYFAIRTRKGETYWFQNGKLITLGNTVNLVIGTYGNYDVEKNIFTPISDIGVFCIGLGKPDVGGKNTIENMKADIYSLNSYKSAVDPAYIAAQIMFDIQKYFPVTTTIGTNALLAIAKQCITQLKELGILSNDTVYDATAKQTFVKLGGKLN